MFSHKTKLDKYYCEFFKLWNSNMALMIIKEVNSIILTIGNGFSSKQ